MSVLYVLAGIITSGYILSKHVSINAQNNCDDRRPFEWWGRNGITLLYIQFCRFKRNSNDLYFKIAESNALPLLALVNALNRSLNSRVLGLFTSLIFLTIDATTLFD